MPLYEGIGLINEKYPVVIEIGSRYTKVGFAGENAPRAIIPSQVGKRLVPSSMRYLKDFKSTPDLYNMMADFLQYIYCKILLVTPKDRKVVVVESIFCTTEWRETLARVLYLHFEVLNVLWLPSQIAAVAVTGLDTAMILDIGCEEATVIPIFKGVTVLNATFSFALGAKKFDEFLKTALKENCLNPPSDLEELLSEDKLEDIRTRFCFVAPKKDVKVDKFDYLLDGSHSLEFNGVARHAAGEVWFNNADLDGESLPMMVIECLKKCPLDTRRLLAKSILVIGGSIMMPGFRKRLLTELWDLEATRNRDRIEPVEYRAFVSPVHENCVAWLGGGIYGATEAVAVRGTSKESFLRTGFIPDWSNLNCNSYQILTSTENSPTSSPAKGV